MEQIKDTGLSRERIEEAKKKHAVIDPECTNLSPEEITQWHPIGGISWEERKRRMQAAGIIPSMQR